MEKNSTPQPTTSPQIAPIKRSFFRRFWWLWIILGIGIILLIIAIVSGTNNDKKGTSFFSNEHSCPSDLTGIFTSPMVEMDKIAVLTPLGNVNGTSHILPVDHVYFQAPLNTGKHETYSPADMTITNITWHQVVDSSGSQFVGEYYYEAEICNGLKIWVAGLGELSPALKAAYDSAEKTHDETTVNNNEGIINDYVYPNLKVKAGDLLGYAGMGKSWASIEITVMNTNVVQEGVDWSYYQDRNRKGGIMCFADLYSGDLKNQLYDKFGYMKETIKEKGSGSDGGPSATSVFTQRTIEPRCGTIYQNINGTIQGDWFYGKPKGNENLESLGRALAFLHFNVDPTQGMISIGGTVTKNPMSILYEPTHSGTINREPSEVRADGKVYCYNAQQGQSIKILVQLIDDHNMKIESQSGVCSGNETFVNSYNYER